MHRLRTARLAALLVGLAMVAAGCGGGGDEGGGDTAGGSAQVQQGGTLNYAADQEPTGFNNNTSKDNGTSVANIVDRTRIPVAFHAQPDFTVKMDDDLLDSAEQTSEDPQTIVYKIKQNAVWSDGTPISADDFIYFWKNQNGTIKDNDVAATTGYDQIKSVEGSDNGKTVTVVFKTPFADWKAPVRRASCPAHYVEKRPGGWNTGLDKDPEKIPVRRLVQGRELHPWPEPDPGPQRQVLRAQVQPGLGGVPVPARVDHPAGGAAEQRGRPDLPAAPARPGDAGQGPARRDQRDQLRAVVRALRLQLQERAPRRPQGPAGDRHRHQRPGAGRPHRQAVQRQGRPRWATASG